jgi:hypothetical protein
LRLADFDDFCLPDFVDFVPVAAAVTAIDVDGFSFVVTFSFFPIASR